MFILGWMNNLKVAYKLLILNIVAATGIIIIGFAGYSAVNSAAEDLHAMYDKNLMSIYYIGRSRYSARFAQVQVALAPLTADPSLLNSRKAKFDGAVKDMDENIVNYNKIIEGDAEQQAILNEIKGEWEKFKQAGNNLMNMRPPANAATDRLVMADHRNAAMAYYEKECMPYAMSLGDSLLKLQEVAHKDAEEMLKTSEEQIASQTRNVIIAIVGIIIVLVLIGMLITKEVSNPMDHMVRICTKLRDGDFRKGKPTEPRGDEFGVLTDALNEVRNMIGALMGKTSKSAEQLAASSEELTASSRQSAQASEQVAQSVTNSAGSVIEQQQYVNEAMEAIDHALVSIENLNKTATTVAEHAAASNEQASVGSEAVDSAVNQILSVERIVNNSASTVDSKEIGQIVETISGIAEQTNLLALNAAIEAARAGSQGRGFAVVADEVRKLAEESQSAAQKIASLIGAIQNDTDNAVQSMHEGSVAVREGTKSVEQLRTTFDNIREASNNVSKDANNMVEELKAVSEDTEKIKSRSEKISEKGVQVSTEMESVSAASQQQSASAEEIASASDALANLAQDLQGSLQRFQY